MTSSLFGYSLSSLLTSVLSVFFPLFQSVVVACLIWASLHDKTFNSSSFLQATLAPSWWSIRKRCTSLRTAGRHGDRYITSSTLCCSSLTLLYTFPLLSWKTENLSTFLLLQTELQSLACTVFTILCFLWFGSFTSLSFKVFEEEHHILYLDHGGVIVAIKDTSIPLKILK